MSKTSNLVSALVIACTVALAAPAVALAAAGPAPSVVQGKKHKAKVEAKADKSRVKVGEETKIKGSFADLGGQESLSGGEPVIVQQLKAGVWVNLSTGTCRPNGNFVFSLSFSLRATVTLRVFHPETDLYVSAVSSVFGVVVI
ncbi:hypothetical protein SAMN05421837_107177 [Amycolatopsis pretoriensis]|uniref:Secreted protein n=1 Tax=Amycolatopsis pretoriensis TaxID=218821 RepID=A0A1H5R6M7_9PSEU|nr:hypothetical protein [Amycolatopsis pretoriensis]SEF34035.1 hypothetical protein SAMN05421837_107177 [Amycolatopsis pretoriensis]